MILTDQKLIEEFFPYRNNQLLLAEKLSKIMNADERNLFMQYINILPKVREKFGFDAVCDRLAFEQATAKDISQWKSSLWASGVEVADLCCGMGGDSFFIRDSVHSIGVDIDENRVAFFNENMCRLGLTNKAIVQNALEYKGGDFFCIDPARRNAGSDKRIGLNPPFESVLEVSKKYAGGMIKLPPAFPESELPLNSEVVYLGGANDCRECLAIFNANLLSGRFSELPKNNIGNIHAVSIVNGDVYKWQFPKTELSFINLKVKNLGAFIFEPNPVLVRSHLFLSEAHKFGLWQIDSSLAYLSGDAPISTSPTSQKNGFSAYRIIDQSGLSTGAVKTMLKKHNAGKITLKKRGVEVVPEQEIKRLAPKGENEFVLFYTRIMGEKRAILAMPSIPYLRKFAEIQEMQSTR